MPEPVTVAAVDLRTVLDQRIMHSHERPGVWDADNRPGLANTACVECAARARLREALAAAECGHPYHGGDGGPCPACGFDVTAQPVAEYASWLAAIDVQAEAGPLVPALAAVRDEIAAAVHGADALVRWRANGGGDG